MNENRVVVCFGYDLLVPIYTQKLSEFCPLYAQPTCLFDSSQHNFLIAFVLHTFFFYKH